MVEVRQFKDRLQYAMKRAGASEVQLREHLGVTRQAVTKWLKGTSKKMEAGNNIEAAEFLGVDPYWLATGKGDPHSSRVWPFHRLQPAQWHSVPETLRKGAEDMLLGALPDSANGLAA